MSIRQPLYEGHSVSQWRSRAIMRLPILRVDCDKSWAATVFGPSPIRFAKARELIGLAG